MVNSFSLQSEFLSTETAQRIKEIIPKLSISEARVAQYILLNLDKISYETGVSIAEKASVSQITVSRFLKRAGYKGICELKDAIKKEFSHQEGIDTQHFPKSSFYKENFKNELQAMMRLYQQFESTKWEELINCTNQAKKVYISGFQTIRGTAEDFSRRLSLARDNVQYLSPHDGMLGEWLALEKNTKDNYSVLIILDIIPYAKENRRLCKEAVLKGMEVIIITDEFCHWASEYTKYVVYCKSKSGLFLESSWGFLIISNMLVHCIADKNPNSDDRVKRWQDMSKRMGFF